MLKTQKMSSIMWTNSLSTEGDPACEQELYGSGYKNDIEGPLHFLPPTFYMTLDKKPTFSQGKLAYHI